jgi:hypothetical protein
VADFVEALERAGFRRSPSQGVGGDRELWTAAPNRFLTEMVHVYRDGTALFTWEFAIADYLAERGLQVGTAEADNQFLYPREDARGRQDAAWLTAAIGQAEALLSSVRLDRPDGA